MSDAGQLPQLGVAQQAGHKAPAGWRCNLGQFGSGDGCHCGCGALDPDCADPAMSGAWGCAVGQGCVAPGVCSGGALAATLLGGESGVRSASRMSPSSTATSPPAVRARLPRVVSFVAADPDDADSYVSLGDTLMVVFDQPTDRCGGPSRGDKAFVDDALRFQPSLGADYSVRVHTPTRALSPTHPPTLLPSPSP